MENKKKLDTRSLVLLALLTGIAAVLTLLAAALPVYPFTLNLALVPMVIGGALLGPFAGGWLGFTFGFVVLVTGGAAAFFVIDPALSVAIVLLKGTLAGVAAALGYRLLAGKNKTAAAVLAAVLCPLVNTGIFALGVLTFFLPTVRQWGAAAGFNNAVAFVFTGMVGMNILFELGVNILLSPVIVRLIQYGRERKEQV